MYEAKENQIEKDRKNKQTKQQKKQREIFHHRTGSRPVKFLVERHYGHQVKLDMLLKEGSTKNQ